MTEGGGAPYELIDLDVCERMGWTLEELDRQDMTRVLPVLQAVGIRDSLRRVFQYLETQGKYQPSESDWEIWRKINEYLGIT